MKRSLLTALLTICCSYFQACGPEKRVSAPLGKNDGHPLTLEWISGPATGNPEKNIFRVLLPENLGESYRLEYAGIYMSIHGHGGDDMDLKIEKDQRHSRGWIVSNFSFTMSGPWELNLRADSSDENAESMAWEVKIQVP